MFTIIKKLKSLKNPSLKFIIIFLIILGFLISLFFLKSLIFRPEKKLSPLVIEKQTSKEKEKIKFDWQKWQDPAGFSFEYPKTIEIDSHSEDKTNYAHLELSKKGKKGKIIILCNDTDFKDVQEWLEKDKLVKNGKGLATTVASITAMRAALGGEREITGFIDWDEVIYTIDLQPKGEEYWRQVYNHILDTFKLIPLQGESDEDFTNWLEGFDTSQADIVEPVEIIK